MRADSIYHYDEIDSTNDEAKRLICARRAQQSDADKTGGPSELCGVVITASKQTNGRGRLGRSFSSPGGDSIYASFILKPPEDPAEQRVTAFAAVAVCLAIEKTTSYRPGIKWINDILMEGKKICGILAESVPGAVILGIGININLGEGDFPDELKESAGSLILSKEERARLLESLQAEVFRCMDAAGRPGAAEAAALMDEYRARSVVLKKPVLLLKKTETASLSYRDSRTVPTSYSPGPYPRGADDYTRVPAFCEGLADDGALIVRFDDGTVEELRSGEVTVQLVS